MNTTSALENILTTKKSHLLSLYGETAVVSEPIVKSEETEAVVEETAEDKSNLEKAEQFAILESIATGTDIEKSNTGEKIDPETEKEESEKTAPKTDTGKEDEEKEKIKKGIEDLIMKGELTDKIAYGYGGASEAFKFVKTGADIKAKLPIIIGVLQMEKATLIAQLNDVQTAIGIAPSRKMSTQFVKDIDLLDYPYDMCDAPYDDVLRKYGTPTDQNLLCSKYNSLAYICKNVSEDIVTAQTVLANVEDEKTYTLSVNQLVALGFTDAPIQKSEDWYKLEAKTESGLNGFLKSQKDRVLALYGNTDIEKSEDNDLEKSGEGSKGGKVIGHTTSGKAIYEDHNHKSHDKFTSKDHMDASNTHMSSDKSTLSNNGKDEASAHHYRKTDEYKEDLENRKKQKDKK